MNKEQLIQSIKDLPD
jgi:hypothetical protein